MGFAGFDNSEYLADGIIDIITPMKKSLLICALLVCLIMALCPAAADAFSNLSPYSYCAGSPINLVDPTGCEIDMTGTVLSDAVLGHLTTKNVIRDLNVQTGLQLSLDENNKMQYAKDETGAPIISQTTDKEGKTIDSGSKTARALLIKMIDHKATVTVGHNEKKSGTEKNQIGLCPAQIDMAIHYAQGVDGNTLGYGMTFLHELHHTDAAGHYTDCTTDYGTGSVVNGMNVIRRELNAKGFNYGQRMNYYSIPTPQGHIIAFDKPTLDLLQHGLSIGENSKYTKSLY